MQLPQLAHGGLQLNVVPTSVHATMPWSPWDVSCNLAEQLLTLPYPCDMNGHF